MWEPGAKPEINDDLMEAWLLAVVASADRGISGQALLYTMEELVDHLSAGARKVVKADDTA